jgi:hypothetical protein
LGEDGFAVVAGGLLLGWWVRRFRGTGVDGCRRWGRRIGRVVFGAHEEVYGAEAELRSLIGIHTTGGVACFEVGVVVLRSCRMGKG